MTNLRLAIVVILVGLVVLFTLQNVEMVTVQFLIFQVSMSRAILIMLTTSIGILIGYIVALVMHRQKHRSVK